MFMSTLVLTIALAFVIVVLAVASLAISWLLKGKSSIRPGSCGKVPTQKRDDESCGTEKTCDLCKNDNKSQEKKR